MNIFMLKEIRGKFPDFEKSMLSIFIKIGF